MPKIRILLTYFMSISLSRYFVNTVYRRRIEIQQMISKQH